MKVKQWNFIYYPPLILIFFAQLYGGVEIDRSLSIESDLLDDQILVINRKDALFDDSSYHNVEKRSVNLAENNKQLNIMVSRLNATQQQLLVHWAGEGSNVIICLARNTIPQDLTPSSVFISYDYGKIFVPKTEFFVLDDKNNKTFASIDKFYPHKKQKRHIVFMDKRHRMFFITKDFGESFVKVKLDFEPKEITYSPEDPMVFLVHDKNNTLWLSMDLGSTFSKLASLVESYAWAPKVSEVRELMIQRLEPNGSTLIAIEDYRMATPTIKSLETNVDQFKAKGDFMFVTKKINENHKELYVRGPQDSHFHKTSFDSELNCQAYHVADASETRLLVAVAHTNSLCNLYVSEQNKDQRYMFRLSLEKLFCFFPNTMWKESWLSDLTDEAFADIYKVQGLRGIYIASQVMSTKVTNSEINPEFLTTVITFDWGGEWRPIKPPSFNHYDIPYKCQNKSICSLHLSQKLSQLYPTTRSVPILSSASAPGLIIATGTVGTSLKGHAGVFMSRDAGLTWHQVLMENYLFNFGDHGGVTAAVKFYKSISETNEFLLSTDEGESFKIYKFIEDKIKVYGVMTEPGESTTVFTLFGSIPERHAWMIINIDVKNIFEYNCTKDDYKMWSPSSGKDKKIACVMGRKETYERRVRHANCYNGKNYDRPVKLESCPCDIEDFECDFGFIRHVMSPECIRNKSELYDPYAIPSTCAPGSYYNRTKGYRRIDGDACIGGYERTYLPDTLPCPMKESKQFLLAAQKDKILQFDLDTHQQTVLPIKNIANVISVDFDMSKNCVYFADIMYDKIGRQCLSDGESGVEFLVETKLSSVEGIAFDWISKMLYFVDGLLAKIEVIRTDIHNSGRMRRTLLDKTVLKKPRGIALHPVAGYMFWTDWSESDPSVNRANLDGSNIVTLFKKPQVHWPNGITVDFISERIFWVDANLDYVASADLNGKNFRKIISSEKISHPFSVAVYKENMYWDDWKLQSIYLADKDSGFGMEQVAHKLPGIMGLRVFAESVQSGMNNCSEGSNPCSHLCFAQPKGKHPNCLCPDGMILSGNECLCLDGSKPFANNTCPKGSTTCAADMFTCNNDICIPKLWMCDNEDDCGDNSDELHCNTTTCASDFFTCPDGKCIPNYWVCDQDMDCTDGADEKDCHFEACKNNQFTCKNNQCISSKWVCDGESDCKDGSDEANCTTSSSPSPTSPTCREGQFQCPSNGICIPFSWRCDGEKDCPDNSDEANCTTNVCQLWHFQCNHTKKCIFNSWKCDGDYDCGENDKSDEENCPITPVPPTPTPSPVGRCKDWTFRCLNDSRCIPNWWKCDNVTDCADGSDELGCFTSTPLPHTTPTSPSSLCKADHFKCLDGDCIPQRWVCDAVQDCSKGEDELHCPSTGCRVSNQFKCRRSSACIPLNQVCDGVKNCPDGSDESMCSHYVSTPPGYVESKCPDGFFACDGGNCYPLMVRCDGIFNCYDSSDEANCTVNDIYYQVTELNVDRYMKNSTYLHLLWQIQPHQFPNGTLEKVTLEFLPSIAEILVKPNAKPVWKNHTSWITTKEIGFGPLNPFSLYNMTVYVRVRGQSKAYVPAKYIAERTAEGVPSEPWNITAVQLNERQVLVRWSMPHSPKGIIKSFMVYFMPPMPAIFFSQAGDILNLTVNWSFQPETKYTFWVTSITNGGTSLPSNNATIIASEGHNVTDLKVTTTGETWAMLQWVKSSSPNITYSIKPAMTVQNYPYLPVGNTHKNFFNYTYLSPGMTYIITVQPQCNDFTSTGSSVRLTTLGNPLPSITGIEAAVINDTNIKVTWNPPKSSKKIDWEYSVYYSIKSTDFSQRKNTSTKSTSEILHGLEACEPYLVGVGLVGPLGPGPVSMLERLLVTNYDKKAPPKNLMVKTNTSEPRLVRITWSASCPTVRSPVGYELIIHETTRGTSTPIIIRQTNLTQFKTDFTVHYGANYLISVKTTEVNATLSEQVQFTGPLLPVPHQVIVQPDEDNTTMYVYWSQHESHPSFPEYEYEVLISEGSYLDTSSARIFKAKYSPYKFTNLKKNSIYTFAVRLVTSDGYRSSMSEIVSNVSGESSMSEMMEESSMVLRVMVPIALCLALGGIAIGVFLLRHRKTSHHNISLFSHYNSRSPNPADTDSLEDEDSPAIRGFSDDEPLVVA